MAGKTRDVVILFCLFLVGVGVLVAAAHSFGLLSNGVFWRQPDGWVVLAFLAFGAITQLALNLWAIQRREFLWYREPVVSAIIMLVLAAILFPVFVQAREQAVTSVAAAAVPARTAVKVSPGQEFIYSGSLDVKLSGRKTASGGSYSEAIASSLGIRALIAEADPSKGYTVILMRRIEPRMAPGKTAPPIETSVSTVRYGADLKPTTPFGHFADGTAGLMQSVEVPFGPYRELKVGHQWRQSGPTPELPFLGAGAIHTVVGKSKFGDRSCLQIASKLTELLPYKENFGNGIYELAEYRQTRCVDPETGVLVSHELHTRGGLTTGDRRGMGDHHFRLALQKTRQLSPKELASRVEQTAAIERIRKKLFPPVTSEDRETELSAASMEISDFRRQYPDSLYAPVLTTIEAQMNRMRLSDEKKLR